MERFVLVAMCVCALAAANEDWANCSPCRCSWVNGRKNADCRRGPSTLLSGVPRNLSAEIRAIDFSDQDFYQLTRNAFFEVNLGDLQKIKLVKCRLADVDRHAFRHMQLLIELDMSKNAIGRLDADTFRDNKRLRVLNLNDNKIERLEDGLFVNLTFLQRVDVSNNVISVSSYDVFGNNPKLQYLMLADNRLTNLSEGFARRLGKISYLSLHNNPWRCDCHLKAFRDFTIEKNLVPEETPATHTACAEPARLKDRRWTDLTSEDFACRPRILVPPGGGQAVDAGGAGANVTLACKVTGDPKPDVNWVFRHAIVDANPRRPGGHRYSLTSARVDNGSTYWANLTIVGVGPNDGGVYRCAAKNPGGIQERNLTLTVGDGGAGMVTGGVSDTWVLVLFVVLGVVIVVLLVTVVLWCCVCRRRSVARSKGDPASPNGDIGLEGTAAEMEKSLITAVNPVVKPPRQYSVPPSVASGVTEVSEVNRTLLDSDSVFAAGDDDSRSFDFIEPTPRKTHGYLEVDHGGRGGPERPYPPDLLSFPARLSQVSPAGSSASTVPDHTRLPPQHGPQSPIHSPLFDTPNLYRTLPYSRSQSPFTSPLGGPAIAPRSGYVTIPRRPRVPSWSSAPPGTPLAAEPVYDNLGLRTTAEGSSVLSLNKIGETAAQPPPQPRLRTLPAPAAAEPHSRDNNWVRVAPEGSSGQRSVRECGSPDARRLSSASLASVPEGKKVPPRPPPKPKKSASTGPLFEDEGEDGTEV